MIEPRSRLSLRRDTALAVLHRDRYGLASFLSYTPSSLTSHVRRATLAPPRPFRRESHKLGHWWVLASRPRFRWWSRRRSHLPTHCLGLHPTLSMGTPVSVPSQARTVLCREFGSSTLYKSRILPELIKTKNSSGFFERPHEGRRSAPLARVTGLATPPMFRLCVAVFTCGAWKVRLLAHEPSGHA